MSSFRNIGHCEIRSDWADISLGDEDKRPLLVMRNGLTKTQSDHDGTFKVSRIETISNGVIDESRVKYLSEVSHEEKDKYLIRKNDILFSHINSDAHLGKTAIAKKDYDDLLQGMNLLLFRVNEEILDPEFLFFTMNYYKNIGVFISICSRAVNQSSINQGKLKALKVPLPPLPEQYNIAHILSKIQSAIETQEKIIQTTTELKKALMQKLFTEGLKGEPQKETEIGLVPKSWEVVKVDDLGGIVTGTTPPTKKKEYYENGGFQFISPVDLGETKYVNRTEKEISSEGLKVSRVLPKDTVLVVCIGSTTGKVGLTSQEKSTTNQQINAIICNGNFNPHFIYYILDFKKNYIRSLSTPSPVPILTKGQFQKAVIPITKNKQEQDGIAKVLSVIDEKTEQASRKKQTLRSLFQSMLHHLMTGQIRAKDIRFS